MRSRFPPTLIFTLIVTLNAHFTSVSYNLKLIRLKHPERERERNGLNATSWKLMQKNDLRRKWSIVLHVTERSSKTRTLKRTGLLTKNARAG